MLDSCATANEESEHCWWEVNHTAPLGVLYLFFVLLSLERVCHPSGQGFPECALFDRPFLVLRRFQQLGWRESLEIDRNEWGCRRCDFLLRWDSVIHGLVIDWAAIAPTSGGKLWHLEDGGLNSIVFRWIWDLWSGLFLLLFLRGVRKSRPHPQGPSGVPHRGAFLWDSWGVIASLGFATRFRFRLSFFDRRCRSKVPFCVAVLVDQPQQ